MYRLRQFIFACLALCSAVAAARGAVQINDVTVTNVGTSTFTAVWTTSELSNPGLDVYSDAAGTNPITAQLGLEWYPISEGNVAVVNDAEAREARRSLELLAINRRVVMVRVTNLSPETNYYFRPRSFADDGTENGPTSQPLVAVKTAGFNSMISDARLLRVRFPSLTGEGMVAVVAGPAGSGAVSTIVGDSADEHTALIPLSSLVDAATGTNAIFASPQEISIKLLGADAPAGVSKKTIDFTSAFNVAKSDIVEVSFSSPGPIIDTHPADVKKQIGELASFAVVATGPGTLNYQWQRKPARSTTWSNLANGGVYAGATSGTLSVSNLTYAMNGDAFRAIVSNGNPPDAMTDAALLSVSPLKIARGGILLDRRTNRMTQVVTITNMAGVAVNGPIRLALDGLSSNTSLLNKSGDTVQSQPAGSPFIQVTAANVAAGASIKITLQFAKPASGSITYLPRVIQGSEVP